MIDSGVLILKILPAIIGVLTAAYSATMIARMGTNFFRVVTGWGVALLMAALVVLWAVDIWEGADGGPGAHWDQMTGVAFVVLSSWLGVSLISMTTVYGKYSTAEVFGAWQRRNPVNMVTAYGALGIAVFAIFAFSAAGEGGDAVSGWPLLLLVAYLLAAVAGAAAVPIVSARRGQFVIPREGGVQLITFAATWMAIPSFECVLRLDPGLVSYFGDANPLGWILLVLFLLLMRTIFTTRFMAIIVDPEIETSKQGGFRNFDIPRGIYLVYDERPDSAFTLFSELVSLPLRPDAEIPAKEGSPRETLAFLIPSGLVMTRVFPEGIREKYKLQVTPIIWLTESPGERRIAPTSLAMATDTVVRFMEANPNSIVLLEGLEYFVTFNEFRKVLKSLDSLNETAWITKARLIIAVNPKAFDERDLALLERDRAVLRGPAGIEELKRESRVRAAGE